MSKILSNRYASMRTESKQQWEFPWSPHYKWGEQ